MISVESARPPVEQLTFSDELMRYAFKEAVGIDIDELKRSADYRERVEFYRSVLNGSYSRSHGQNTALNAGVHRTAEALSFKPKERDALYLLEHLSHIDTHDSPEEMALVELLGRKILQDARSLLTPRMVMLADRYKAASAKERTAILGEVYDEINCDERYGSREERRQEDELGQELFTPEHAFPRSFKGWPFSEGSLNCFGMSIMLAAFAEEAGADYLFVNQMRNNNHYIWSLQKANLRTLDLLLSMRQLEPNSLKEVIRIDLERALNKESTLLDFHHSVAVKVKDTGDDAVWDSWQQLDPYMHTFAPYHQSWGLDVIEQLVKHYADVLPGLTVTGFDRFSKHHFELYRGHLLKANVASVLMQIRLEKTKPETFGELIAAVQAFLDEDVPTLNFTGDGSAAALRKLFANEEFWLEGAFGTTVMAVHPDDPEQPFYKRVIFEEDRPFDRFSVDPGFRQRCLENMITEPLAFIMRANNSTMNILISSPAITPDPSQEFARPDFMIGLLMLNHLRAWSNYGNTYDSSKLAEMSSSQIFWHEALQDASPVITPAMVCMSAMLRNRNPLDLHERVELQLALRPHLGEEHLERTSVRKRRDRRP